MNSRNRLSFGSVLVAVAFLVTLLAPSTLAHPDDDPRFCERYPDDPKCEPQEGEKKTVCEWRIDGAPANGVTFNAHPGSQVVTLECPHHIVKEWKCGYKSVEQPFGDADGALPDPKCEFLGTTESALSDKECATTSTWVVNVPNVRTYTMSLKVSADKDEDCDGKADDWNAVGPDGRCRLNNVYSPKQEQEWTPYKPSPDGKVDECDTQFYEHQWRQFN